MAGRGMALYDRPGSIHMSSALIRHVSDDSFEQDVLQADSAVLVDFWAEWCGPCKMVAPILDEIAGQYDGRLNVVKMNVDDNQQVPAKFGIRGIPTLMIFKAGQLVATKVGALPKAQLTAFIDSHL
jgi:thioredoxin 1